eukprot:4606060-Prymnesium_polylepis.1
MSPDERVDRGPGARRPHALQCARGRVAGRLAVRAALPLQHRLLVRAARRRRLGGPRRRGDDREAARARGGGRGGRGEPVGLAVASGE